MGKWDDFEDLRKFAQSMDYFWVFIYAYVPRDQKWQQNVPIFKKLLYAGQPTKYSFIQLKLGRRASISYLGRETLL